MTLTDVPTDEVVLDNPESVAQAVAGEQPDISPPEDPIIELPRGIFYEGDWQKRVELHELTGEDEERFSRFKEDELFLNILTSGVDRIGGIDLNTKSQSEQEQIIQSLLVGEQLILVINIIRVTFGDDREFNWVCRNCSSENTTTLILSEDFQPTVPDDISDPHSFTDSKGNVIKYVPVSGVHIMDLKPEMSQGVVSSQLLERVVTEINGERLFDTMAFIKKMGLKDRRVLLSEIDKAQPVTDMSLTIACTTCGEEQTSALTWVDLFRI